MNFDPARRRRTRLLLAASLLACASPAASLSAEVEGGAGKAITESPWKEVHDAQGIVVWRRLSALAGIEEYKAIGNLELPAAALVGVLRDRDRYSEFFPYVVEDRAVSRADGIYRYERLRAPFVAERDYTVQVFEDELPDGGLRMRFREANAAGPPPSPVRVRVQLVRGMWEVVAVGESRSRVTYHLLTDPGGAIPDLLLSYTSRRGVLRAVAALRDRTRSLLDAKRAGDP